jgi:hypothetical protein
MKDKRPCPKCQSRDVARFPGWSGGYGSGNYVITGRWFFFPETAPVARYVCRQCGFVEEWIDTAADLEKVRESAVADNRSGAAEAIPDRPVATPGAVAPEVGRSLRSRIQAGVNCLWRGVFSPARRRTVAVSNACPTSGAELPRDGVR